MTEGFMQIWNLLEETEEKLNEFIMWRFAPGYYEICDEIDKNPADFLENHLDLELQKFAQIFSIEKDSSLILISFLISYIRFNNDLIFIYFLNYYWLSSYIGLQPLELLKYQNAFEELRNKEIININFYNYELAVQIQQIDQTFCDQYGINKEISYITCFNKSFELTEIFIEKLKNL